jgi:GNAT superfamily N-acetyltransferase
VLLKMMIVSIVADFLFLFPDLCSLLFLFLPSPLLLFVPILCSCSSIPSRAAAAAVAAAAGLSRMMLDSFEDHPVLLLTKCGNGAAVLLHSSQFASLAADVQATPMPFSLTPGSLQMLTAVPEDSLPITMQEVQQVYEAGLAAMQQASSSSSKDKGHSGEYLQLAIIGVTPAAQGRGLGMALLQAAVAVAQQEGLPLLVQAAGDGVAEFYAKAGMQTIGRRGVHPLMLWKAL